MTTRRAPASSELGDVVPAPEPRIPPDGPAPDSPDPVEVELKFDVLDQAAARALVDADVLEGLSAEGPLAVINVTDRYLDTRSGTLRKAGWVGRLRVTGDGLDAVLALKTAARRSSGAVHRREELQGPARLDAPPADWPPSAARDRLIELLGESRAVTTIVLEQRRRQRVVAGDGLRVEVSLDRVRTLVDDRVVDRSLVLEAELLSGPEARLVRLGEDLGRHPYLVPATISKLDRSIGAAGRARLAALLPAAAPARSPVVRGDDRLAEAGRSVLAFHLARLLAYEPGTREGRDPEELHQMRVATRRMRAAWRFFGDAFDPEATRSARTHLRMLAAALGTVRDLDVLLEGIEAAAQLQGPRRAASLGPWIESIRAERERGRADLIRLLERPAHRRWLARSVRLLTTPGAGAMELPPASPSLVRERAPSRIWAAYEQVRAYGAVIGWADIPTIHALRIDAKRFRYALEFMGEALGPEGQRLIARMTALQDELGLLNDADVAAARARRWLDAEGAHVTDPERAAVERYMKGREREMARRRRGVPRAWAVLDAPAFRRRLGRAVATL